MTVLIQDLRKSCPEVMDNAVAGFRAALVALGREVHDETKSQDHSLKSWWQWLDDEGYDRQAFAEVLHQVGRTRIGAQAYAELLTYVKSIEHDSNGISILIDYVNSHNPDLAQEIAKIEELAEEEENQLLNMAGGMSKRGKEALIGVAGVAGVGLVGLGVKGIHSYWKRTKVEREARLVADVKEKTKIDEQQEKRKLENVAHDKENLENEYIKAVHNNKMRIAEEVRAAQQEIRTADFDLEVEKITIRARNMTLFRVHNREYFRRAMQTVANEDGSDLLERIAEKFVPSEGEIKRVAAARMQDLSLNGVRHKVVGVGKQEAIWSSGDLEDRWFDLAIRAELRKDREAAGQIVDLELKPNLGRFLKDSTIDTLFDLDAYIWNQALAKHKDIEKDLDYWGSNKNFARAYAARYPSVKKGIREYIREVALGDYRGNMQDITWDRVRKNLKAADKEGIKNYYNSKGFEELQNKAEKDAKRLARKQIVKESQLKAEALQLEKNDLKAEVKRALDKKIPELEKKAEQKVIDNDQAIMDDVMDDVMGDLKNDLDQHLEDWKFELGLPMKEDAIELDHRADTWVDSRIGDAENDIDNAEKDVEGIA